MSLLSVRAQEADIAKVEDHLNHIVKDYPNRNFENLESLDGAAEYVFNHFSMFGYDTHYQHFGPNNEFKNVIASFGPKDAERIIIGAHYDVCGFQDGADDNASGVVGVLELARLLAKDSLDKRIDLVAYSLEEPPFFRTDQMGSAVHAKYLVDEKIDVYGMICLEMIGYFSDERRSQHYPLGILKLFYGSKGDYITYVKRTGSGKMAKKYKKFFKRNKQVRTKIFTGPAKLQGIDFSDHLNYWANDIDAVMITNTGFFRNQNYHEKTDKIETLDLERMTAVIQQVYLSVLELCKN